MTRPDLLGAKPCMWGNRIGVEFVLALLASGASTGDVLSA